MCFFAWFSCGFVFVQMPLASSEIKNAFFPSDDVVTSVIMVSAIFSLTLLSRFFGSLILNSVTNKKGMKIVAYTLCSILVATVAQYFLIQYSNVIEQSLLTLFFITIRLVIGFCVGGIWPSLAVFTLEEYYRKRTIRKWREGENSIGTKEIETKVEGHDEYTLKDRHMRKEVHKYSLKSAFIQNGFTFALLIEGIVIILLLNSTNFSINIAFLNLGSILDIFVTSLDTNLPIMEATTIIGILMLLITCFYWFFYIYGIRRDNKVTINENITHEEPGTLNSKDSSLRDLLTNKKYRSTLIRLWLILTGLMYMFYSTVVITPEIVFRQRPELSFPVILILIWLSSVLGHLILGLVYHNRFTPITKLATLLLKIIEIKDNDNSKAENSEPEKENKDILAIFVCAVITLILASIFIIVLLLFPDYFVKNIFYILLLLIFIANTGWAIVHTTIFSRFPKHFRILAAGFIYNGGLIISFASPFVLQELAISGPMNGIANDHFIYIIILIPMVLGSFAILYGSLNLMREFLPNRVEGKSDLGFLEVFIPSNWYSQKDTMKSCNLGHKCNVIRIINRDEPSAFLIQLYFFKNKQINLIDEITSLDDEKLTLIFREEIKYIIDQELLAESEIGKKHLNSNFAKRITFYSKNKEIVFLFLSYSGHYYAILYDNTSESNSKKIINMIVDTFDIKIPI